MNDLPKIKNGIHLDSLYNLIHGNDIYGPHQNWLLGIYKIRYGDKTIYALTEQHNFSAKERNNFRKMVIFIKEFVNAFNEEYQSEKVNIVEYNESIAVSGPSALNEVHNHLKFKKNIKIVTDNRKTSESGQIDESSEKFDEDILNDLTTHPC